MIRTVLPVLYTNNTNRYEGISLNNNNTLLNFLRSSTPPPPQRDGEYKYNL
jgi:hypothetical protein